MVSVFEKYPNLPGFATEFKDGGLQVRTETPVPGTDSVLLLGTAVDGPVGEPVAIDANTVELVFGGSTFPTGISNGSTLVKAFYEAYQGGSRDIRLMRVSGSNAVSLLKGGSVSRSVETTVAKKLGLAPGNGAVEFTLNAEVITVGSVIVNANGYDLAASAYTVTNGTAGTTKAKVALKADMVDSGANVYITYAFGTGDAAKTVTENGTKVGEVITYWVATGTDKVFALGQTAKAGSFHLYANGIELPATNYTLAVGNDSVTLKSGSVERNADLEATFINAVIVNEDFQVKLESVFGGALYNQSQAKIEVLKDANNVVIGTKVSIVKPESKKAQVTEPALEYTSVDFPTLGQLVQAINADNRNNVVRASVSNRHVSLKVDDLKSVTPFIGGGDGVNIGKQEMFNVLGGTRDANGLLDNPGVYHLLENYTVDTIIPLGVFADDVLPGKYDNFASQLALACAVISHRNHATNGMIATSSPDEAGLAAVQAHVKNLLAAKNDYFMRDRAGNVLKDNDGRNIDLGRFISVVAGPDVILNNNRTGAYADNSVSGYGGFVSQLPIQSGPTNKVVAYAKGLRFSYSNSQLDALTAARYVTLRMKDGSVAVVDGPTAAQANSDYTRVSTSRVVKEVVNELRKVCDPYIGEPNEIPQRNAMSAAISKRFGQLVDAGIMVDYDFLIISTPQMQLMGESQIELTIVPPQELRQITTIVGLKPSL